MAGRFSYIKYDQLAVDVQNAFKKKVEELESMVQSHLMAPEAHRPVCNAMDHLEEFYMWVGKAIRDRQIARAPEASPEQPERTNG